MRFPFPCSAPSFRRVRRDARGFSLVEVTLSVGIVAFGLVSIMGLLPTGLNAFRTSVGKTVSAQVAQSLLSEARQAEFAHLVAAPPRDYRYFDNEGVEVSRSDAVFAAKVTVEPNVTLPGPGGADFTNPSLALVRVSVVENPRGSRPNETAFAGSGVHNFSAYVAKTE